MASLRGLAGEPVTLGCGGHGLRIGAQAALCGLAWVPGVGLLRATGADYTNGRMPKPIIPREAVRLLSVVPWLRLGRNRWCR